MAKNNELVVGLDIGTTKICAIVGEIQPDGSLDVVGIGSCPSRGLRKGAVVNIESTVNSIRRAIEDSEMMAGCEIKSTYVGIAGGHIRGINSHGIVAVKDKEVRPCDIRRVIDAARAMVIPMDREVIHILPQEYIIDNQDGIKEPLGMSGVRLEAKVHLVTGACSSAQNLIKCVNKTGLDVADIVLQQLASSMAVLNEEEKELGVALIDIGGGTTDIAIFANGSIVHTSVLTLGGNQVTNDIALGLRTPAPNAEKLKIDHGCAMASLVDKDETIEVTSVGGRNSRVLARQILCEIIEPRVEEIFALVKREGMAEKARNIYDRLKRHFSCFYDEKGAIGRRYRRQDEAGTPFCITVDGQTKEDTTVTVRERDSMEQVRVSTNRLLEHLRDRLQM